MTRSTRVLVAALLLGTLGLAGASASGTASASSIVALGPHCILCL